MERDIQLISLDLVKLDQENVRFGGDFAGSQKEALRLLMENPDDARKLYRLARDISLNGMDPTELQLIFPEADGGYIVIEGNRRLAALKLLINPDLCPIESLVKKFIELKHGSKYAIPKSLAFSLVPTRAEGDRWIELKHTGENEGVGRVGWSSDVRDERKSRITGIDTIGRQIRNLISEHSSVFSQETEAQCESIPITNLTRLFQSSSAKNYFKLSVKNKVLTPEVPIGIIAPSVSYAIRMMTDKNFTVKNIFYIPDIDVFINKIPPEISPDFLLQKGSSGTSATLPKNYRPESDSSEENEPDGKEVGAGSTLTFEPGLNPELEAGTDTDISPPSHAKPNAGGTIRAMPDRKKRVRLIDWPMKIEPASINDLFRELRNKLDVKDTPVSVAVAFRVFLEVSCEYYIKQQQDADDPVTADTQQKKPLFGDDRASLATKVQGVAAHLAKNEKLSKGAEKAIKRRAAGQNTSGSIDHLNQFVHGYFTAAIPAELNAIADEYKPLLEKIWS